MPRLFVAIDLPRWLKDELLLLRQNHEGIKWLRSDQLHLTLRFIGDVDDTAAIQAELAKIEVSAFRLQPAGTGVFPSTRAPRVLWIGLQPEPALFDLQQAVERAVATAEVQPEPRAFSAHITMARLKEPDLHWVKQFLQAYQSFLPASFAVNSFHLYSSRLLPSGAQYRKEATFELADQIGEHAAGI